MIETATGLILRTRTLTETSLIVEWLTPELGRFSTVAKGARRPRSPFLGKLDLFYLTDFSFSRSQRSDLHTLREVKLIEPHAGIRRQLEYLEQASYCAALIEQTTERETPLPSVFELMRSFLSDLPTRPPQPQNVFAFELRLLDELGLKPELENSTLKPGTREIAEKLSTTDWTMASRIKPSSSQIDELRLFLHGFLIFHLGRIPKGRDAAIVTKS